MRKQKIKKTLISKLLSADLKLKIYEINIFKNKTNEDKIIKKMKKFSVSSWLIEYSKLIKEFWILSEVSPLKKIESKNIFGVLPIIGKLNNR